MLLLVLFNSCNFGMISLNEDMNYELVVEHFIINRGAVYINDSIVITNLDLAPVASKHHLFSKIQKGDRIIKRAYSDTLYLKNKNINYAFLLNFNN